MALMKCPECGQSVSSHADCCQNCGCPIQTVKSANFSAKRREIIKVFLFLFVGILCIVIAYSVAHKLLHQGYYNHYKWGTSFESFQEAYPDDATLKSNQKGDDFFRICDSFEEISGVNVTENYHFDDEKLYSVGVTVSPSEDSGLTARQLSRQICEKYNKYYGNAERLDGGITSSTIYKWSTSKSHITLYTGSVIVILYEDVNHIDSSKS